MPVEFLANNTGLAATSSMSVNSSWIPVLAIVLTVVIITTITTVAIRFKKTMIGAAFLLVLAAGTFILREVYRFSKRTVVEAAGGDPHLLWWVGGIILFIIVSTIIGPKIEELFFADEPKKKKGGKT